MLFTQIDVWIGKTLFVPLIVKLCQLARQSQFAVSRLFWFVAALDAFYHAETMLSRVVWAGMSVFMMVTAARRADQPASSLMFLRLIALVFLILDLARGVATGAWAGAEFWFFFLVAEYAATIHTLPPQDVNATARRSATKSKRQFNG